MNPKLREVLEAANTLPPPKEPKSTPLYPSHITTTQQKRKFTALAQRNKHLEKLNNDLCLLRQSRKSPIQGLISKTYKENIRDLRLKIARAKRTIKSYQTGIIKYRNATQFFSIEDEDAYTFIKEFFLHEYTVQRMFNKIHDDHISEYSFKDSPLKRKKLSHAKAKTRYFRRIKMVLDAVLSEEKTLYLEALDGKWIIRHLERIAAKLERERSINHYLFKEIAPHKENPNWKKEQKGGLHAKRIGTYDLGEIHNQRPIKRLVDSFGCQLREDERNTLIQWAQFWVDKFKETWQIKI